MQAAQNASPEQARQQSMALLNQHLAAAVILQDRMHRSARNLMGANFVMVDATCAEVSSLMETCTVLITARLTDLGGTAQWPVGLAALPPERGLRRYRSSAPQSITLTEMEPLDAFGQSVLEAATVVLANGDTTTAEVMEQVWRRVDRQLWNVEFSELVGH